MTPATRTGALRGRWAGLLLAALVAVLAMLFGAGTASASGLPAAETRVGVSTLAAPEVVGVHECITAGQHWVRGPSQLRLVSGHCVAAEAETVAINGETAATAYGKAMHASWDYGPGFRSEFTLKAGGRVDGINFQTREIIELKPNNPRAIRMGNQQLDDYIAKLNAQFPGDPWTGRVVTYDRP